MAALALATKPFHVPRRCNNTRAHLYNYYNNNCGTYSVLYLYVYWLYCMYVCSALKYNNKKQNCSLTNSEGESNLKHIHIFDLNTKLIYLSHYLCVLLLFLLLLSPIVLLRFLFCVYLFRITSTLGIFKCTICISLKCFLFFILFVVARA